MPDQEAAKACPATDGDTAQFFFENSVDMLAVVSADGCFASVNEAWSSTTGWPKHDLLGARFVSFVHPDDYPLVRRDGLGSLAGQESVTEFRFRNASGVYLWLRSRARLTPTGQLTTIMRDITQERRREAEVEDVRSTRKLLGMAAGVGVWRYHPVKGFDWSDELAALSPHLTELGTVEAFRAQVHPDDIAAYDDIMRRGVVHGESATYELRFRAPDGSWRHFRSHHQARKLPSGLHELHAISQEVTELARARDVARHEGAQARSVIETAPFAVALFDHDLRYQVASPLWADLFDTNEHILGISLEDRPNCPPIFKRHLRRALGGESTRTATFDWTDPKGRDHVLRWTMRPYRDETGAITGAVAYVDDIHAFQRARREAEINARRLDMALTAAGAGVIEIDYAGQSVWSSPAFDRIVGRKLKFKDVSRRLWPIIDPSDNGSLEALRDWWERDAQGPLEIRALLPGGEHRWVRMFFDVERGPAGDIVKMSGLVQDVHDAKLQHLALLEAERRANAAAEAKSQFLANMSHEIRTPLNGVLGVLHLLEKEPLSADGKGLLDEASACGRMLAELLNDVIDFSRIEAGKLDLHPETIDVAALVQGAVRLLAPEADAKGLALQVEAPEVLWATADPVRLRQALFNLVGNAVKFTTEGAISVRVCAPRDGRLRFEVHDTGPGIAPEDQPRLFDRFQQVDGSSTRRHGGSGLGLAITRKLAQLMGGEVTLASTPGVGSCFTFEVNAATADPAVVQPSEVGPALDGLRVLLVEDNATNRLVIGRMLQALGASVETAEDGREGLEAALRGGFDLIFMDVQMPVMDGLEAVRRLRRAPGPARSTPVVALTANALSHQADSYRAAGMDGVVAKPVSPAALLAEVARLAEPDPVTQAA